MKDKKGNWTYLLAARSLMMVAGAIFQIAFAI